MKLNLANITIWLLRILAAIIMLQTLYFKFTAHPQSVKLFTELGMEPWGRIGVGTFELIASILLLIPRTTYIGAAIRPRPDEWCYLFSSHKAGNNIRRGCSAVYICSDRIYLLRYPANHLQKRSLYTFRKSYTKTIKKRHSLIIKSYT
jgi:hypothetical protein